MAWTSSWRAATSAGNAASMSEVSATHGLGSWMKQPRHVGHVAAPAARAPIELTRQREQKA
jgi:hypothetical protein